MTSSIVVPGEAESRPERSPATVRTRQIPAGERRGGRLSRFLGRAEAVEQALQDSLRPLTLPTLRILMGTLFVWFGALKVAGVSPVEGMVSGTLPWLNPDVAVIGLGGVEVLLGAALVAGLLLRLVLPVLIAHLGGTFLTFVMLPGLMVIDDNPLLLTEAGEFVVKNLVLISAALVLMTHTPGRSGPPRRQDRQ